MTTTAKEKAEVHDRLARLGVSYADACALRRISMTLQRWFELECGDSNNCASWSIERDENGEGPPFMVTHMCGLRSGEKCTTTRQRIPDREAGARKRLATIMQRYSRRFIAYVQTDPRGAALYLVRRKDVPKGADISSYYSHGTAIY